jgi:3-oxoacyl-[acyl-carrier protein] reductase
MDLGLQGKRAVVFASSKGIGRGIAERLAQEGVSVAICARNEEALRATEQKIRTAGGDVLALVADVARHEDIQRVVAAAVARLGTVHVLVTNAGGPPMAHFEDATEAQWGEALNLNLLSTIRMCREVLPYMKAQRWGRIIHVNSTVVKEPSLDLPLSSVARSGVVSLNKILAIEYAQYNITSNNIAVAGVWTERTLGQVHQMAEKQGISDEEIIAQLTKTAPAKRAGTLEEVSALAAFLASDLAGYVNGQNISFDGAFSKSIL